MDAGLSMPVADTLLVLVRGVPLSVMQGTRLAVQTALVTCASWRSCHSLACVALERLHSCGALQSDQEMAFKKTNRLLKRHMQRGTGPIYETVPAC
jgi:hypothetical protein